MSNANLRAAKKAKNDEFYTRYEDIVAELCYYKEHFRGKTVYINCDNPEISNFWKYFVDNFHELKLRKLMCSWLQGGYCEYIGKTWVQIKLPPDGEGDFRNFDYEMKEADIIVGNPPFSLFREFIGKCVRHRRKFLVIGNLNAIKYKEIFPLIKKGKVWLGYNQVKCFLEHGYCEKVFGNVVWFTNLGIRKANENLLLKKQYNPVDYPKYDNYDAINIDRVADIPCDYNGIMGVPITFLDKCNPERFEIIGLSTKDLKVNGKKKYERILIRRIS